MLTKKKTKRRFLQFCSRTDWKSVLILQIMLASSKKNIFNSFIKYLLIYDKLKVQIKEGNGRKNA